MKYYSSSLSPSSPIGIELISAVKHLKGSEVAPRGLFQGFLKIRKSKKTIQDLRISKDVITTIPVPPPKRVRDEGDKLNC